MDLGEPRPLRVGVSGSESARAFAQAAAEHGYEVHCCEGSKALVALVLSQELDLVVAHIDTLQEVEALASWFAGRRPSTHLVVCCEPQLAAEAELASQRHKLATVWEEGESVQEKLDGLAGFGPRKGLVGRFLEIELVDYLQVVSLNASNKLLRVQTAMGSGYVWFERGSIVHAEFGDLQGEQAFFALVSGDSGFFCEVAFFSPPRSTIESSNTHLIMEATRLKDESAARAVEAVEMGPHSLDAELYDPMYALGLPEQASPVEEEEELESFDIEDLGCANELDFLGGDEGGFMIHNARDFVSHCNAQPSVIQATSFDLDEANSEPDFDDELRCWGLRMLPALVARGPEPSSTVWCREGQTHFVGIFVSSSLVVMQVLGTQDPFELRDHLMRGLG